MLKKYRIFLQLFLQGKSIRKFLVAVIIGLSFSMSIVLATLGLMDGFDVAMKKALRNSQGDLLLSSRSGKFFAYTRYFQSKIKAVGIPYMTPMIQTEGFAIHQQESLGILLRGIEPTSFAAVIPLGKEKIHLRPGGIVLGKDLAFQLKAGVGSTVHLLLDTLQKAPTSTILNQQTPPNTAPSLHAFRVDGLVDHGLYKKNLRFAYVLLSDLQEMFAMPEAANLIAMSFDSLSFDNDQFVPSIMEKKAQLTERFGPDAYIVPFWQEYNSLLEAVQIEKLSLSLILQVVVVVSIFNILSFLIFLNEKKAKEIFLLEILGAKQQQLAQAWRLLIFVMWLISCFIAVGFCEFFDFLLSQPYLFKMPESIYHLPQLRLILGPKDYSLVFLSAFAWAFLLSFFIIRQMRKMPLLHRVRKEFGS